MPDLTHLSAAGQAQMVDVAGKAATERVAIAEGRIVMRKATLDLALSGNAKKGDVFAAARIAAIMAAKKTHDLIPLCHPLALTQVSVDFEPDRALPGIRVRAIAKVVGQTGVEMEALTAVSIACLTIYDMLKAVDRSMRIEAIALVRKSGGKSGDFSQELIAPGKNIGVEPKRVEIGIWPALTIYRRRLDSASSRSSVTRRDLRQQARRLDRANTRNKTKYRITTIPNNRKETK